MEDLKKLTLGALITLVIEDLIRHNTSIYRFSNIQYKEYLKNLLGMMKCCPYSAIRPAFFYF